MFDESWVINYFLWLNLITLGWSVAAYIRRERLSADQASRN